MNDHTQYRSIVWALQYLTFTRLDIAHAINMVCQYMIAPTKMHFYLVKRILRYIQGRLTCGLKYSKCSDFSINAYSDSDWAADINTHRSITGYVVFLENNVVFLENNLISWHSKKQFTISRSSKEAEYKALAHCAVDVFWICSVLKYIHQFLHSPPCLCCDYLSALAICSNPVFHSKIKHLDTDYHFVREKVHKGDIVVQYIPLDEQVADILTKRLHNLIFVKHCHTLARG